MSARAALRCACRLLALLSAAAATHAQVVQGQVDAVGFEGSNGSILRPNLWCPIRVTLAAQGSQIFAGSLRAVGPDLDGDRVGYVQPQVTVAGEGPPKRFWCHMIVGAANEVPGTVEVLDSAGIVVAQLLLPPQPPHAIAADDLLILDISYPAVTALNSLQLPAWAPGQPSDGLRPYYRNVVVTRMAAADLPDRWFGLEAVNVIVWDQPDFAALSLAQRDALLQWVRSGGQLILGVGAAWETLRKSELAPLLPLTGDGPTVEVERLDVFLSRMALSRGTREFPAPVVVTTAARAPDAVRVLGDFGPGNEPLNLITMRLVGSGRVTATAASLRDLTSVTLKEQAFFAALLDLNAYTRQFNEEVLKAVQFSVLPKFLYGDVTARIGFGGATVLRVLTAFLFVSAYIVLATLATWWWLKGRKLTHLSWTAFAACAVLASVLSLGTVSGLRGCSRGVQSFSILDLDPETQQVRGYALFGYRSPIRQRVTFSLPGDENFLRPLGRSPVRNLVYMTPARYAGVPGDATLEDVLMRATLKQFEGYWQGPFEAGLRGDLTVDRGTGRLTAGSWLVSDLPVTLTGAVVLFVDPRQDEGGVPRAAGLIAPYPLPLPLRDLADNDVTWVPPAANVLVLTLPLLETGQELRGLGQAAYEAVDKNLGEWRKSRELKRSVMPDLPTLWDAHREWGGYDDGTLGLAGGVSDREAAMRGVLLASTRSYYLNNASPSRQRNYKSVGAPVSTEGLPELDISHWLLPGTAVVIAWTDTPGPARLHRAGRAVDAYAGMTFYRARLPLNYVGTPPPRGSTPSEPRAEDKTQ